MPTSLNHNSLSRIQILPSHPWTYEPNVTTIQYRSYNTIDVEQLSKVTFFSDPLSTTKPCLQCIRPCKASYFHIPALQITFVDIHAPIKQPKQLSKDPTLQSDLTPWKLSNLIFISRQFSHQSCCFPHSISLVFRTPLSSSSCTKVCGTAIFILQFWPFQYNHGSTVRDRIGASTLPQLAWVHTDHCHQADANVLLSTFAQILPRYYTVGRSLSDSSHFPGSGTDPAPLTGLHATGSLGGTPIFVIHCSPVVSRINCSIVWFCCFLAPLPVLKTSISSTFCTLHWHTMVSRRG